MINWTSGELSGKTIMKAVEIDSGYEITFTDGSRLMTVLDFDRSDYDDSEPYYFLTSDIIEPKAAKGPAEIPL